jgi:hypothetical protein
MATLEGTVTNVTTVEGFAGSVSDLQVAQVLFNLTGTYVQADDATVLDVAGAIEGSRRNGKTVTLVDAMCGWKARIASDPSTYMALSTLTIDGDNVDFAVTLNSMSTEYTNATALVATSTPFCMLVSFTEA